MRSHKEFPEVRTEQKWEEKYSQALSKHQIDFEFHVQNLEK